MDKQDVRDEFNLAYALAYRAGQNHFRMFTIREIATMMLLSEDAIQALRRCGAPFPFGKTRPEWLMEFMQEHPEISIKSDKTSLKETVRRLTKAIVPVLVAGALVLWTWHTFSPSPDGGDDVVAQRPIEDSPWRMLNTQLIPPPKEDELLLARDEYRTPPPPPQKSKKPHHRKKKTEQSIMLAQFGSSFLIYDKEEGGLRFVKTVAR